MSDTSRPFTRGIKKRDITLLESYIIETEGEIIDFMPIEAKVIKGTEDQFDIIGEILSYEKKIFQRVPVVTFITGLGKTKKVDAAPRAKTAKFMVNTTTGSGSVDFG